MTKIQFIKSAVDKLGYPTGKKLEVAIVGRSNSGKSSFINALAGNSKMAKVSSQPGKTRLLNFFLVNDNYFFVDMPGYGFAARAGAEVKDWRKMIEGYLLHRKNLSGLVLIMDIRREWQSDEQLLLELVQRRELPIIVVLNKADKLGSNQKLTKKRAFEKLEGVESVHLTSALSGLGIQDLEDYIYANWIKKK